MIDNGAIFIILFAYFMVINLLINVVKGSFFLKIGKNQLLVIDLIFFRLVITLFTSGTSCDCEKCKEIDKKVEEKTKEIEKERTK